MSIFEEVFTFPKGTSGLPAKVLTDRLTDEVKNSSPSLINRWTNKVYFDSACYKNNSKLS